ncbi:SnoaL-like domain-containing protein [Galbibacter mesophilus]|uniref:SnoaL-like domain-containing protein n=1 Tax=Galbibacter mesophilus TaxID=379069 RepID=UPI00191FD4B3|nr:SnoaL-like domain-containing protein [Galbibacter mesophilus]MCM5663027.1 nuclear transport factor 2 family protein [Galbibacter mesophilus]
MNTKKIAHQLVSLCRNGKHLEAYQELYDDFAISKEKRTSFDITTEGKARIIEEFLINQGNIIKVHSFSISEPLVADHYFVVKMTSDTTFADIGRVQMEELCLYKVENDKITEAQFFYEPLNEADYFMDSIMKRKKSLDEELFV